jgi:ABC-type uncharacterized transport system substrate-binding protein
MKAKIFVYALLALILAAIQLGEAQQRKVYRVGVPFLVPGEAWSEIVDGFRVGIKELGLGEG